MRSQILVLLWKELLMRKNHYITTSIEVLLPIGLIVLVNLSLPSEAESIQNDSFSFERLRPTHCTHSKQSIYKKIVYEPSTPFTDGLMSQVACYAGYKKSNVRPGKLQDNTSFYSIGVKFENADGNQNIFNYTLLPANKAWERLNFLWRDTRFSMPRYSTPTVHRVVELQRAIDVSYLEFKKVPSKQITFRNIDLVGRNTNIFSLVFQISVFVAFLLMVPSAVGRPVQEKCSGAKELMLTMGMVRCQLWAAKFLDIMLFSTITISGMVVFVYVPLKDASNVLVISPLVLWIVLFHGVISVVAFFFFISCLFESPAVAVYLTEIILSLSFVFRTVVSYIIELPAFCWYILCLLPHISLLESVTILLKNDEYGKDIKLLENLTPLEGSPCLLHTLIMTSVDILIYTVFVWYLEQVKPGKYGLPRPYNFCFQKYYWFPRKALPSYGGRPRPPNDNFELVDSNLKPGVTLSNVTKLYTGSDKTLITAVKDVNLNFYFGEISGVLGHNGAGKTTLFSIITGMTSPSEGRVFINGFDMSIDICEARRSLGLCPQQDMLFDDLTVIETLEFYGLVKGLKMKVAKKEALALMEKLKLTRVTHTRAKNLSGGQKRKVSLGIALIGGSEVLILDEPTSGMDTEIRREIWELLLKLRESRTIVLTTHFMEEADALCDRIAILDHGEVKCHASPMFLKSKLGKEYTIKIVFPNEGATGTKEYCSKLLEKSFCGAFSKDDPVPFGFQFQSQNGRILTLKASQEVIHSPRGVSLLETLEEDRKTKEIKSFCFSPPTLEDVFLRMRREGDIGDFDVTDSPSYKKLENTRGPTMPSVSPAVLTFRQFWALLCKKFIFLGRFYKTFLMFTLLPAFIVTLLMVLSESDTSPQRSRLGSLNPLTYSLDLYPSSLIFYSNLQDTQQVELLQDLVRSSGNKLEKVADIREAVEKIFLDDFYAYIKKINFGIDFASDNLVVYHNDHGVHMVPVSLNFIHNFLLKTKYKNETIITSVDGRFANKELSFLFNRDLAVQKCRIADLPIFSGFQTMFYLLGPLTESRHGAKEIQLMTTTAFVYWSSHLVFDFMTFAAYIAVLYLGMGFSLNDAFMIENWGEVIMGLFLWGCGLIQFSYMISTLKNGLASAFSMNIIFYTVFSFFVHNLIGLNLLPKTAQYLHPSPMLMRGFSDLCSGARSHFIRNLVYYNCVLFAYLIAKDSQLLSAIYNTLINKVSKVDYTNGKVEEDVAQEEQNVKKMVNEGKFSNTPLVVDGLKRWYFGYRWGFHPFPAVGGVSFTLNQGECFGLLGVNGAGKTSTFKMLAGMLPPSQGGIYACSKRFSFISRRQYLFSIGYCPQSGGLIPSFNGRELLTLFARLRGLRESNVEDEVEEWLERLNLLEYAKEPCRTYSGGNKRKLSTAIAMVGGRPLILLDEPTSGVDPLSRRSIWRAIRHIQSQGRSIILTSHSMDECESLASRIAIMVRGMFRCIGETPTLKEKFGLGYWVHLKLLRVSEVDQVKEWMCKTFGPFCKLVDEHFTILQYHLSDENINCGDVFRKLQKGYCREILESYAVGSASLEQIFIHLARSCEDRKEV